MRKRLRRVLLALFLAPVAAFVAVLLIGRFVFAVPPWKGPKTDHFDGERFFNPGAPEREGGFWKWQLSRDRGPWPDWVDAEPGPAPPARDALIRLLAAAGAASSRRHVILAVRRNGLARPGELPVERGHRLSEDDKARRLAILRLMCQLDLPYRMLPAPADESAARLGPLVDDGLVAEGGEGYRVTPLGRWFLRNIALALDAYLPGQTRDRPVFSRAV